jgi:hypothetical protein
MHELTPELLDSILLKCLADPLWESQCFATRALRPLQSDIIKRVERHINAHNSGVMVILCPRQIGKNEMSAVLQMRHLIRNQFSKYRSIWIRTAPTHEPQIVVSKRRLEVVTMLDRKNFSHYPLLNKPIIKSEGYIWRVGNATVEFMSSGPHSNVVGATASECLDMDEAHKILKDKFDEDFSPFTASTSAGSLLWGVASDGLDAMEWYKQKNIEQGRPDLNICYPVEHWMDNPKYENYVNDRVRALGWDHPIIKTQFRLIPVSNEGTFLNKTQVRSLCDSQHDRQTSPRPGVQYEMVIDLAAGNEDFDSKNLNNLVDTEENRDITATDSTVVWVYEVTQERAQNNIYPVCNLVELYHWTGKPLPDQEREITELIQYWKVSKVTVDGVGVGRQLAESLEQKFGTYMINKYIANQTSISEDLFDLLARLNYGAVKMFRNDSSREYHEFERQVSWTKYASSKGKMTLAKPSSDKHIDMVKALTYINRNAPNNVAHQIMSNESQY